MKMHDLKAKFPALSASIIADPLPGCTSCGGSGEFTIYADGLDILTVCPCAQMRREDMDELSLSVIASDLMTGRLRE